MQEMVLDEKQKKSRKVEFKKNNVAETCSF